MLHVKTLKCVGQKSALLSLICSKGCRIIIWIFVQSTQKGSSMTLVYTIKAEKGINESLVCQLEL